MDVQLRIALSGATVGEVRSQEPKLGAVPAVGAVAAEPRDARVVGEVADGGVHCGRLGLAHVAAGVVGGECPERRDRLRRRERDVPRGHATVRLRLERLAGRRIPALENSAEVVRGDLACQPEVVGEGAVPHTRRFTVPGVVIVTIRSDLVDVVGDARTSTTGTDRSDRCDHQQPPAPARQTNERRVHQRAANRLPDHTLASTMRDANIAARARMLAVRSRWSNARRLPC
jgi:hypothetical protein